ncbi:MAG: DUF3293 domain-containing protein [Rhodobacteraceae bacterium]|nr:DUF3293 domain-containing protein [Paracoccaceae bacterium]
MAPQAGASFPAGVPRDPGCDPRPLSPALQAAYRATAYTVDARPDWTLRVDAPCPALSDHLSALGLAGAVCLTGWNLRGWRRAALVNVTAQARLVARLAAMGLDAHPGWGRGDAGDWPPERHVLAPGLSLADGRRLARDFGQRAVLWFPAGGVAVIVPTLGPPDQDGLRDGPAPLVGGGP